MARKHKGSPINGWVVIDKPAGVTSIKAVSKARWAFQAGKAGHAGTLDPLATGVLAIAFGEATKTVALAQEGLKTYRFTIRLGQATSTDDAEGEVIATSGHRPTDAEIEAALPAYVGDIKQVPPQFSAVKVAGERAYDLAREGVAMDLAARPLHVESLKLITRPDPDHAELEMVCGKGGYPLKCSTKSAIGAAPSICCRFRPGWTTSRPWPFRQQQRPSSVRGKPCRFRQSTWNTVTSPGRASMASPLRSAP
jgi:tRNA pseudouridine55 synthase